jgi:hypothetical protein
MKFEFNIKFDFSRLTVEWPKAVWSRVTGFLRGLQFRVTEAPAWAKLSALVSGLILLAALIFIIIRLLA